ncbi:hypothetical protein Mal65_11450 [Crateriforma conspicua]|nr:hypothetical protein Mal65_11450 [Crateriforma conspicua]
MLKNFREQYKEAQQAREEIDAKREEWLKSTAAPLLDAMEEQLRTSSLPEGFRSEITEMRQKLITDAYFAGVIETADVAKALNVDETWVRKMAGEGRIGLKLTRHYVHSAAQIEHFKKMPRHVGPPSKKGE